MIEKFSYIVTEKDAGRKIKDVLRSELKFSTRFLRRIKDGGEVRVKGISQKLHYEVNLGDYLEISIPDERSGFEPENIPLEIVYEDNDLLIINKQPFLVVHPTKNHQTGTVANAVMNLKPDYKIRFVNRLDRDTSGLLIIAKNAFVQDALMKQMKKDEVIKKYIALVHGEVKQCSDIIDLPLGRDEQSIIKRKVIDDGENAVTEYKVIEQYKDFTLLELTLKTGRTHQIRVHLSHIGHPIVGDTLYGDEHGSPHLIKRQALHAKRLVFTHPVNGEIMDIMGKTPKDIIELLESVK